MQIQFLGHSAFFITSNNYNILIDPFIKDNPLCNLNLNDITKLDYILITHGHSDHLGDTLYLANKFNCTVVCNFEISLYLSKHNIKCAPMHIGGKQQLPFATIKMINALHGSSILENNEIIYAGNPCGYLLLFDNYKIYHAGDTGLTLDMKLLELENIDLAMLPIGSTFTMDIEDCLKAIEFIKPKKVIPMHYNTFELIKADPIKLKSNCSCEVDILSAGDTLFV